jgi:hypothetical protein
MVTSNLAAVCGCCECMRGIGICPSGITVLAQNLLQAERVCTYDASKPCRQVRPWANKCGAYWHLVRPNWVAVLLPVSTHVYICVV